MLLLDVTHTSHTRAQTGIQRVCRTLAAEWPREDEPEPLCHDPHLQAWRRLDPAERRVLADRTGTAASRGARWTLAQKLCGRIRRLAGRAPAPPAGDALLCPELFSPATAAGLTALFARVRGPRVALFHDAIALRLPELSPRGTVARMPAYLRELLAFDGVAAVSEDSARSLREYWAWLGATDTPPVAAIPLGVDPVPGGTPPAPPGPPWHVLCVSTLEGRKNHLALLEAAEALWADGADFVLELVGMPRADTGAAALARVRALQAAGRPLRFHGSVSETELAAAYARCAFTVYPSLSEGFGLPVFESLRHGRPCVSSTGGALVEAVPGGGVLPVTPADAGGFRAALRGLLTQPAELHRLTEAARGRKLRTWGDCIGDLRAWMATLRRRG